MKIAIVLFVLIVLLGSAYVVFIEGDKEPDIGDSAGVLRGSIIIGPVVAGPTRPGQVDTAPMPDADIVVMTEDGTSVVVRVTSDSEGMFEVMLPAGRYTLTSPQSNRGFPPYPANLPTLVIVEDGQITDIVIEFDSGIR